MTVLGLDTSNYTTSAAWFDGTGGQSAGTLLEVGAGELGLRQSEALFQHVKRLPGVLHCLGELPPLEGVGASVRPRPREDSYMPCFLAGESQGRTLAAVLGIPFWAWSHQEGHLAAAAWSAGRLDLLEGPFLAWHPSGGTTELVRAQPWGAGFQVELLGGSSDLSAGQLIDRAGVALGLAFPAGAALDALYRSGESPGPFRVKLRDMTFSLSGMENQVRRRMEGGDSPAQVAGFVLDTVSDVVLRATRAAMERYPGLPVLCCGGVASNRRLRQVLEEGCGAVFAAPAYSTDNAMGTAILTWRARERGERGEL